MKEMVYSVNIEISSQTCCPENSIFNGYTGEKC